MVSSCAGQGTLVSSSDEEVTLNAFEGSAAAAELVRLAKLRIAGQAGGQVEEAGLDLTGAWKASVVQCLVLAAITRWHLLQPC